MIDNKSLELLYQELDQYKSFDADAENCERFLNVVDQIVLKNDPESLLRLFKYFDDESDFSWVMESLKCAIENYPDDVYVEKFLEGFDNMWATAPEWTQDLLYTILNNSETFLTLKKLITKQASDKLFSLLDKIQKESPRHAVLIQELKKELIAHPRFE